MDKVFTCVIYTTSSVHDVTSEMGGVIAELKKTKGISDIMFNVVPIDKTILLSYVRSSTPTGTNWEWFKKNITKSVADMECIHITPKELQTMGLVHPGGYTLGGEYDVDKDDTLDCLCGVPTGTRSNYSDLTEFQRVVCHEFYHGFSHWTTGNAFGVVHDYDEPSLNHNNIHQLAYIYNFKTHSILTKIRDLLRSMISIKNSDTLYKCAESFIGKDASPLDRAPDLYGCADSVTEIIKKVIPTFVGSISTAELYNILCKDKRFEQINEPIVGAIIVSPTGTSSSKVVKNGHTGICGKGDTIMSNSNGVWQSNYTQKTWADRWDINGYKKYYFKIK